MSAEELAKVLRHDSIVSTTNAGSGHPTTCLSFADVAAVLFGEELYWDPRTPWGKESDVVVWSKGHAAPLAYSTLARAGAVGVSVDAVLNDLRKVDSNLEGHPTPRNPWFKFGTGSLGMGVSIGVGIALAKDYNFVKGGVDTACDEFVHVLCGDGEFAEGSVYEGLNAIYALGVNNIRVIVDANELGQSGPALLSAQDIADRFSFLDPVIFDGHDFKAIRDAFANKSSRLLIAKTKKGKGVSFLEGKEGWHGKPVPKDKLEVALKEIGANPKIAYVPNFGFDDVPLAVPKFVHIKPSYKLGDLVASREAYGSALVKLCEANLDVFVFDADTKNSTFSERVLKDFESRFFEAGIAEQNMVGMMLGASTQGVVAFGSTFGAFLSRAYDQLRMAALSADDSGYRAHFVVAGSHCGVSIGEDGGSQMALEDIAMMRALNGFEREGRGYAGVSVLYPADAVSGECLTSLAGSLPGVVYLRLTRGKTPVIYDNETTFVESGSKLWVDGACVGETSKANVGKHIDAVVVSAGITLHEALKAQKKFSSEGLNVAVVDAYCVEPVDVEGIKRLASGCHLISVEDHRPQGGLGSAIAENYRSPDVMLAVRGTPRSGKPEELLSLFKLDAQAIYDAVKTQRHVSHIGWGGED